MGAWGVGILQNDTTLDVWLEFKEMYNSGDSLKKIRKKLEKEFEPEKFHEYYSEIWTGIAYGQWMCGELEVYTIEKVKEATNENWLCLWADDKKKLEKRIKALSTFLLKIQTPRKAPLKRKKIVVRQAFFQTGDIIGIEIHHNQFVAAIVTKHTDFGNDGENTIVFTDYFFKSNDEPVEILSAEIFYLDIGGVNNYYRGYFKASFSARNMAKKIKLANKIGEINITNFLSLGIGTPIGNWNEISELYAEQIDFLQKKQTDKPLKVTIQDFINPDKKKEAELIEWDKKIFTEKLSP